MFTPITNHVQQGLARLLTQYQNSPNFQGLITALISPIQTIENALVDMNTLRYLPNAFGQQLDNIGVIVGLPRPPGTPDNIYIQLLLGQIKENISQGQPEQVIQVFELFTQTGFLIFYEGQNCEFLVESAWIPPDQATVDRVIGILQNTAPAGVRCDGIVSFDSQMAFAYDGNLPGAGYDDGTQLVGGKYAQLFEYEGPGFAYDGDDYSGQGYSSLADPLAGGAYLT